MKHVDVQDITTTAAPVMIKMTRRERLRRWADLIRNIRGCPIYIYHRLEYETDQYLNDPRAVLTGDYPNAFTIALKDPVLQAEGLKGGSIADVQKFMELTKEQLHEFSCDCGGHISNDEMARRIERIAG